MMCCRIPRRRPNMMRCGVTKGIIRVTSRILQINRIEIKISRPHGVKKNKPSLMTLRVSAAHPVDTPGIIIPTVTERRPMARTMNGTPKISIVSEGISKSVSAREGTRENMTLNQEDRERIPTSGGPMTSTMNNTRSTNRSFTDSKTSSLGSGKKLTSDRAKPTANLTRMRHLIRH